MKLVIGLTMLIIGCLPVCAQKMTIAQMKSALEKSTNSPLFTKDTLKKKFKIDTITISRIGSYHSLADSLAYAGKLRKVYGPFGQPSSRFLVQVLAKAPNSFFRISQIFIDTSVFRYKIADSIGKKIMEKLSKGADSFEHLAQTYSMGGESITQGDLGWVARGILLPQIERELSKRKKGELFRVWSKNGLHIIKMTENPKQDTGFALLMRIFL